MLFLTQWVNAGRYTNLGWRWVATAALRLLARVAAIACEPRLAVTPHRSPHIRVQLRFLGSLDRLVLVHQY